MIDYIAVVDTNNDDVRFECDSFDLDTEKGTLTMYLEGRILSIYMTSQIKYFYVVWEEENNE